MLFKEASSRIENESSFSGRIPDNCLLFKLIYLINYKIVSERGSSRNWPAAEQKVKQLLWVYPQQYVYFSNSLRKHKVVSQRYAQPETKAKIHLQWNASFTIFKDKKKKQNKRPIGGVRHIFSTQLNGGFHPHFFGKLLLEEADRLHADDSFWLFYGLQSLNGRNSTSYIFYGLVLQGVLVFVITKTKRGLCFRNYKN